MLRLKLLPGRIESLLCCLAHIFVYWAVGYCIIIIWHNHGQTSQPDDLQATNSHPSHCKIHWDMSYRLALAGISACQDTAEKLRWLGHWLFSQSYHHFPGFDCVILLELSWLVRIVKGLYCMVLFVCLYFGTSQLPTGWLLTTRWKNSTTSITTV